MNPIPNTVATGFSLLARCGPHLVAALMLGPFLLAQHPLDIKPAPTPDPVKGWHDMSPMSPQELARVRNPRHDSAGAASVPGGAPRLRLDRVHFDQPGDDHLWAIGTTYKASFGADGFVFVPFFGSDAPRNYPVQFQLRSVRIGGHELALPATRPIQAGNRVQFARGAVVEQYDLALERVEQTFVIDSAEAGDVEVELQVTSELIEDVARDGLQFGNELGSVDYGVAHVVTGAELIAVPTTWHGQAIRIRVPASLRTGDRLVIDPIIHSSPSSPMSPPQPEYNPDIAYDASFNQYLVVWESPFSAGDSDVWSELRSGNGALIGGSLVALDFTINNVTLPRVANLNAFDRFLTVFQRVDSLANVSRIWGRTRDAGGQTVGVQIQISESSIGGDCYNPDIGGDPSPLAAGDQWLVVWERVASASDFDIHGRRVQQNSTFAASTILIENSAATIFTRPCVSQSNGNGLATSPCWLVAYSRRFSATDYDIWGAALDQTSIVTSSTGIDASINDDQFVNVSSPATDFGGTMPMFMLGYQRLAPTLYGMARLLRPTSVGIFINEAPLTNVTSLLGTAGSYFSCDSDGNRFAVAVSTGNYLATLAFTGTQLVVHEAAQPLPGLPAYSRVVSKRSGGGPRTDYCHVDEDRSFSPFRVMVNAYRGHAPGNGVQRRVMACNGLNIDSIGRSFLGEQLTFFLTNPGSDIPGFAFGVPAPASTLLCAQCPLGVQVAGAILVVGSTLAVPIPSSATLVGAQISVQGFGLGSGPCVASLHFSDTLDFTVQ